MLVDDKGNKISFFPVANPHVIISGKSGYGKSYCVCRMIENLYKNIPVVILDYSFCFTKEELEKNKLQTVKMIDLKKEEYYYACGHTVDETVSHFKESLITVLGIDAVTQWEILEIACEKVLAEWKYVSFQKLYKKLEELREEAEESTYENNVSHLMKKLYHLKDVDQFKITVGETRFPNGVILFQFSGYTQQKRRSLSQFFIEMLWKNIQMSDEKYRVQLVLDEFQNLTLVDNAVEAALREGRRHGLGLLLISQFFPSRKARYIIEQAETQIYFHPMDSDMTSMAQTIALSEFKEWRGILSSLDKGWCVLRGKYLVNGRASAKAMPVLCRVLTK